MGVSIGVAQEHIRSWTARFRQNPVKANWPTHLFHSTDITNAVEILTCGRLICRRDLPVIPLDAANQGALWNNPQAHGYIRLYFRPRNQFHLKTEGIKCLGDPYRSDPHMSIPIMLAFDAQSVLTAAGTGFSGGMLSRRRSIGFDDDFFNSIDFDGVYHDGRPHPERMDEILDKRMAEVVVPGEIQLRPYLGKVICRTPLERRTLLHRLGRHRLDLASVITLEQVPQSTFLHKSLYLTGVRFRQGELRLDFHPPMSPPRSGRYKLEVEHRIGGDLVQSWRGSITAEWPGVRIPGLRDLQEGVWTIRLEEVLAYQAPVPSETSVIR